MSTYEEMMNLYDKLNINDKRNEFSSLLGKTDEIINILLRMENLQNELQVKNYDSSSDSEFKESDMLTFFYEDLWNIKNKLLMLLVFKSNSNN